MIFWVENPFKAVSLLFLWEDFIACISKSCLKCHYCRMTVGLPLPLGRQQLNKEGESVLNQFLSAAVNISGSWLTSPLSVLFTNRCGQNPRREFWQKYSTCVPGKTTASPLLISTQRTLLLQRYRWVLAISLLTLEPRFEDRDTAAAI